MSKIRENLKNGVSIKSYQGFAYIISKSKAEKKLDFQRYEKREHTIAST